jgi:hypothetical protein
MTTTREPSSMLRWRRRLPAPRRAHGRWLLVVLLLGAAAAATAFATQHTRGDGFERLLATGCDEVEPCRALEAEAAERLARCGLSCEREREQQHEARQLLYRAEERRRVREHYRQSAELEGRIQDSARSRRIEDEQRVLAAQARAEERLRKEQLESEQAERERAAARAAEQRARELRYLTLMSAKAREQRLKRCHERLASCDALVELMLDAAQDDRERRRLVEINERALEDEHRGTEPELRVAEGVPRHAQSSETAARAAIAAPAEPAPSAAASSDEPCAGRAEGCCEPGAGAACPDS